MINISQSNILLFFCTQCLINEQTKRLTFSSSTEGTLCVCTVAPCWLRDVHWLLWDKDSALQRTHQQSNHQGGPQRSTVRLKDLLSIYQRRCWEGTSTLKQNWDIFFVMTAIYNRAWMTMKLKSREPIMMSTLSCMWMLHVDGASDSAPQYANMSGEFQ